MAVDDDDDPGTVTLCIGRLKDGDQAAAQDLWERYFRRLVGLARLKLRGAGVVENDDGLRRIAWMKMEGHIREEIARALGCHQRAVANKLKLIRLIWLEAGLASPSGGPAD